MKQYLAHRRTIIFAVVLLCILTFILMFLPESSDSKVEDIEDVKKTEEVKEKADLVDSTNTVEKQSVEAEPEVDKFEFPPIYIPDIPNEPVYVEEVPRVPIQNRSPLPKRHPVVTKEEAEILDQLEGNIEEVIEEYPQADEIR